MLKVFQNQGKALRWLMGIVLFLVAGSMIITLIPNVFGPAGPASADILAEVDGLPVTLRDVEVELRQQRAGGVPAEAVAMLAGSAIENLIAERVLLSQAARLGLVPNDEDLAAWLRDYLPDALFPDGQFIGSAAYEGFIRQQFRRTVAEFEREVQHSIAIDQRLRRLVTDGVRVTDAELKARFHRERDAVRIEWVGVASESLRASVAPTPDQLTEYFDANKLRYRHAERRPLKVMTIGPEAASSEYEVTDAEIDLYYSQNQYRFEQPERLKARHILLLTVDKTDEEAEQARQRAEEILEQLRGGADFAELAAEHSEDPANADTGGELPWFSRGEMDPAFEDASFALQVGGLVGSPVKSQFGYHLIRLDERESGSVKPLSEVRDVIRGDLVAERSESDRYALMERALEQAEAAGPALEAVAGRLELPFQEFQAFSRAELPDSLPKAAALVQAVFEEPVGSVFTVSQEATLYIGIVTETVPAREATYDEVGETVREDFVDTESANLARLRAEEIAEQARDGSTSLAAASGRHGLRPATTDYVQRDGDLEDLGPVSALGEDAFLLTAGELQGPVAVGDRWVVFRTLELRPADESGLAAEGDSLRQTMLDEKRQQVFEYFRQAKLREYLEGGLLLRYDDRIQSYLRSMQSAI